MITLNFICTFKSDVVLHASSNTEGKIERLDYIPGSNFLGMVARSYETFGENAFDVFHSGAVQFGDAHIVLNNIPTLHVPFSWFAPKDSNLKEALQNHTVYNEHFVTPEEYNELIAKGTQLKQLRSGFISHEGLVKKSEHLYTQKSAYDTTKRRSKEQSMFGYYALAKGTKWHFTVELDEKCADHADEIKKILLNSTRLGKSRSAEYGNVEIRESTMEYSVKSHLELCSIGEFHYVFLYAKSRLALTDQYGVNCYAFDTKSLKIEDETVQIDWEKSQIRTSRYTPYVGARKNFDPERLIIDKGSVIALKVPQDFDLESYAQNVQNGIGLYLSEGHGKVLVNPEFLTTKIPLFEVPKPLSDSKETGYDSVLNQWLGQEKEKENEQFELLKTVKTFITEHKPDIKNKKSQWGQIRSLCSVSSTNKEIYDALFDEKSENDHEKGFLRHGKALKKWNSSLINTLEAMYDSQKEEERDYLNFLKLLSIYAPKEDVKKSEGGSHA